MGTPTIGVLTLNLYLPGCSSLKEKRSRIKPLIHQLQREFNVAVAELDHQDVWQSSQIACVTVSNNQSFVRTSLQTILTWAENSWQDIELVTENIEIITATDS
jgi:uncharacterized protein